jgi:hypothetical protein
MIIGRLKQTVDQYGFLQTIIIVTKGLIKRLFGISWYSYYIMHGELSKNNFNNEINTTEEIRKLERKDFKTGFYGKLISEKKWQILDERFKNQNIEGFGIFRDELPVCYGWINYEKLEITDSTSLPLPAQSALLFDGYCHPDHRGQGFHYLINDYRIKRLTDMDIKNVYGIVLKYNIPPIKNLKKLGLEISQSFTLFIIGKKEYCTIQSVK